MREPRSSAAPAAATAATDAVVRLEGVHVRFADVAGAPEVLRGVDLTLERGARVAIVGPSGSGKSTLLNLIGGLLAPTAGRVVVAGDDLATLGEDELAAFRNRTVGFVFQQHHLLPQLTALENVLTPTLVAPAATRRDAVERARELLTQVGLGARLDHEPARLSGGECQRVAVVRALINRPELLLADEPTGALDAAAARDLVALLVDLSRRTGVTLVTVTHAAEVAARMDRTLGLDDGRLTARATA